MIVFILVAVALCLAFVPAAAFGIRRRKKPELLSADWWPKFEAEFRAYAARAATANRAERPDRQRPPR